MKKLKATPTKTGSWYLLGVPRVVSLTSMPYRFLEISTHKKTSFWNPKLKPFLYVTLGVFFFYFVTKLLSRVRSWRAKKKPPQSRSFDQTVLDYSRHSVHSMYSWNESIRDKQLCARDEFTLTLAHMIGKNKKKKRCSMGYTRIWQSSWEQFGQMT